MLCWGAASLHRLKNRINEMIREAGSVIGLTPDSLKVAVGKRTSAK